MPVCVFVQPLTSEEQFKLRYHRFPSIPVSVPIIPITGTDNTETPTKEN